VSEMVEKAAAVINAMDGPTDAMCAVYGDWDRDDWCALTPEDIWKAMLAEALK
jgi:hypothetical protein